MSIAHIKRVKPNHRNLPQTRILVPTLLQSKAIRSLSPARSHLRQERQGDDHFAACLTRADCRVVADAVRLDLMGQVRGPRAWDMGRFVALVWGFRKARCFQRIQKHGRIGIWVQQSQAFDCTKPHELYWERWSFHSLTTGLRSTCLTILHPPSFYSALPSPLKMTSVIEVQAPLATLRSFGKCQ